MMGSFVQTLLLQEARLRQRRPEQLRESSGAEELPFGLVTDRAPGHDLSLYLCLHMQYGNFHDIDTVHPDDRRTSERTSGGSTVAPLAFDGNDSCSSFDRLHRSFGRNRRYQNEACHIDTPRPPQRTTSLDREDVTARRIDDPVTLCRWGTTEQRSTTAAKSEHGTSVAGFVRPGLSSQDSDDDILSSLKPPRLSRHITPPPPPTAYRATSANSPDPQSTSDIFAMVKNIRQRGSIILDNDSENDGNSRAGVFKANNSSMAAAVATALAELDLIDDDDDDDDDDDVDSDGQVVVIPPRPMMLGVDPPRRRSSSRSDSGSGRYRRNNGTVTEAPPETPLSSTCRWATFLGDRFGSDNSNGSGNNEAALSVNNIDAMKHLSPPVCPKKRMSDENSELLHNKTQSAMCQLREQQQLPQQPQQDDTEFSDSLSSMSI